MPDTAEPVTEETEPRSTLADSLAEPPSHLISDAALDLRAQLATGAPVVLSAQQAAELADLVAFAAFARDTLWPIVAGLRPVADRAQQIGAELATMGPMQLVGLLRGE